MRLSFRILCIGFLIFFGTEQVRAQVSAKERLEFRSKMLSYSITQGNMNLGRNRVRYLFKDCEEALDDYEKGNTTLAIATGFQLIGLVCAAGFATEFYFNDNFNATYLIIGGLMLTASIPMNLNAKKQISTGVGFYNIKCRQ